MFVLLHHLIASFHLLHHQFSLLIIDISYIYLTYLIVIIDISIPATFSQNQKNPSQLDIQSSNVTSTGGSMLDGMGRKKKKKKKEGEEGKKRTKTFNVNDFY
jgi:hypothetical protein